MAPAAIVTSPLFRMSLVIALKPLTSMWPVPLAAPLLMAPPSMAAPLSVSVASSLIDSVPEFDTFMPVSVTPFSCRWRRSSISTTSVLSSRVSVTPLIVVPSVKMSVDPGEAGGFVLPPISISPPPVIVT